MPKIILCQGIQGSGKTTWAKKWAEEDAEHRVRWNNDDIRNMLGKYWVTSREPIVSGLKERFLKDAMSAKYDVVIDNMNLNPKEQQFYADVISSHNANCLQQEEKYSMEIREFFVPLEVCIERDAKSPNPIGAEVITNTYNKYKDIIEESLAIHQNN